MISRRSVLGGLSASVLGGLQGGCISESGGYRYRLTLKVDDQGQERTGSSVVQVRYETQHSIDGEHVISRSKGEATYIKLGDGRVLTALLTGIHTGTIIEGRLERQWHDDPTGVLMRAYGARAADLSGLAGLPPVTLRPESLPDLALFQSADAPSSVVLIDPRYIPEQTGGAKLLVATIEVTTDPVDRKLDEVFPWLAKSPNYIDVLHPPGSGRSPISRHDLSQGMRRGWPK